MTNSSVSFRVINARNCPFYEVNDWFILTSKALRVPAGYPSCLILVREITGLLLTLSSGEESGFAEERKNIYNCGGCTGLIKFQIEDPPDGQENKSADPLRETGPDFSQGDSAREAEKKGGSVISGLLEEASPSELFQFFHMFQKTGKLLLYVPSGVGRVAFREGAIIGAKFEEKENEEAIFALLDEHRGRFSFVAGIPASLREVKGIGDFMTLLMEGIKRLDENKGES
ncbi:MAG TPA: hypothetical protein DDY20_05190 [Desulfobulbaceae bacterium]|jgi:hypothetical protein|nr:hypothetical protein [Desulfobulbaceae bacterium]